MGSPKAGGATERVSVELATATATAPSCCAKNSGCSTTCPTPTSHQRTWTPGSPGPPAHVYGRSSGSPAPSAATASASPSAIRLGLSNARHEGLNSKIRLISHRAFGFHSPEPLIALVYLCCSGVTITLPRDQLHPQLGRSAFKVRVRRPVPDVLRPSSAGCLLSAVPSVADPVSDRFGRCESSLVNRIYGERGAGVWH